LYSIKKGRPCSIKDDDALDKIILKRAADSIIVRYGEARPNRGRWLEIRQRPENISASSTR
jgi:hypothetical protein